MVGQETWSTQDGCNDSHCCPVVSPLPAYWVSSVVAVGLWCFRLPRPFTVHIMYVSLVSIR